MITPISYNGGLINDGVDYEAWFLSPVRGLPKLTVHKAKRYGAHPRIGGIGREGRAIALLVRALAGSEDWLRALFNGEDGTPKLLVAADEDGGNQRYVKALALGLEQTTQRGVFVAELDVDDEVRWRAVAPTTVNWTVTASGQTVVATNGVAGTNDEAYPIIRATPRAYMTGLNPYRLFLAVPWPADQPATDYPTDITDGALDTRVSTTEFHSATGDDVRVIVDGEEVDFWLDGVNTATTSIWCNLSWQRAQAASLAAALGVGPVAAVTVKEDITTWPATGTMRIGNEVLTYGAKNSATKTFTGIERAARGSAAAAHSVGAAVRWIQHEIWVEYGSTTLAAKVVDSSRKPMFDLATSTNTSWNYLSFYEQSANRAGAWAFTNQQWTRGVWRQSEGDGESVWGAGHFGRGREREHEEVADGVLEPVQSVRDGERQLSERRAVLRPGGVVEREHPVERGRVVADEALHAADGDEQRLGGVVAEREPGGRGAVRVPVAGRLWQEHLSDAGGGVAGDGGAGQQ